MTFNAFKVLLNHQFKLAKYRTSQVQQQKAFNVFWFIFWVKKPVACQQLQSETHAVCVGAVVLL